MNGSARLILTVLGLFVVLTLALDGYQSSGISDATESANEAKELAVRVEEREDAHYQELKNILLRIERKLE